MSSSRQLCFGRLSCFNFQWPLSATAPVCRLCFRNPFSLPGRLPAAGWSSPPLSCSWRTSLGFQTRSSILFSLPIPPSLPGAHPARPVAGRVVVAPLACLDGQWRPFRPIVLLWISAAGRSPSPPSSLLFFSPVVVLAPASPALPFFFRVGVRWPGFDRRLPPRSHRSRAFLALLFLSRPVSRVGGFPLSSLLARPRGRRGRALPALASRSRADAVRVDGVVRVLPLRLVPGSAGRRPSRRALVAFSSPAPFRPTHAANARRAAGRGPGISSSPVSCPLSLPALPPLLPASNCFAPPHLFAKRWACPRRAAIWSWTRDAAEFAELFAEAVDIVDRGGHGWSISGCRRSAKRRLYGFSRSSYGRFKWFARRSGAGRFCRRHGADRALSSLLSLCFLVPGASALPFAQLAAVVRPSGGAGRSPSPRVAQRAPGAPAFRRHCIWRSRIAARRCSAPSSRRQPRASLLADLSCRDFILPVVRGRVATHLTLTVQYGDEERRSLAVPPIDGAISRSPGAVSAPTGSRGPWRSICRTKARAGRNGRLSRCRAIPARRRRRDQPGMR